MADSSSDDLPPDRLARNLSLHRACEAGDYDECERLLKGEEGADAWWQDLDMLGWSALHYAAERGHTKLVKLLLRRGAIWNACESCSARIEAKRASDKKSPVKLTYLARRQRR